MINFIKSWIRAVVREEQAKLALRKQINNTLASIKPGQQFVVRNQDGSRDTITVKGPKPKAKAKSISHKNARTANDRIAKMLDNDARFMQRYEQALACNIPDSVVLIYEETGGYKLHAKNGLKIYATRSHRVDRSRPYQLVVADHTRSGSADRATRTISFYTEAERDKAASHYLPRYHQICADQARKVKGGKP